MSADGGRGEGGAAELPVQVREFTEHYTSAHTRRTYATHVRHMLGWLARAGVAFPQGVTRQVAVAYRDHLRNESGLSRDTVYQRFVAARQLYAHLIVRQAEEGARPGEPSVESNPFDRIQRPKPPGRFGKSALLEKEDVRQLLEIPDAATPSGRRDLLALYLLFNMGLRAAEVVGVDAGDAVREGPHTLLRIRHRKGDVEDLMKMPDYVVPLFDRVAADRGAEAGPLLVRMFRNGRIRRPLARITADALRRVVAKHARGAGLAGGRARVHPHCGRTFFINEVYARTGSARTAQLAAGHASITTTERYLKKGAQRDDSAVDYVRLPLPRRVRRQLEPSP